LQQAPIGIGTDGCEIDSAGLRLVVSAAGIAHHDVGCLEIGFNRIRAVDRPDVVAASTETPIVEPVTQWFGSGFGQYRIDFEDRRLHGAGAALRDCARRARAEECERRQNGKGCGFHRGASA
jgi:hypothetical protein